MYHVSNGYIFSYTGTSAFKRTHLHVWSTNDGKASWTPSVCQVHLQGTKPVSSKVPICSYSPYAYYSCKIIYFHVSSVMVVDTALLITTTSCAYWLPVPFWKKKKNRRDDKLPYIVMNSKENSTCSFLHHKPSHHTDQCTTVASFHTALFKPHNYCHYEWCIFMPHRKFVYVQKSVNM